MGRTALRISVVSLLFGLGLPSAWAQGTPSQQQQQQKPGTQKPTDTRVAPPAAPIPPLSTEKAEGQQAATGQSSAQNQAASSDQEVTQPLSGAEEYTLGTMGRGHNYFIPIFQVAESGDTNGRNTIGSSTFESVSTISGAFALNHVWSRYAFGARYTGSGFVYNRNLGQSSSAHSFLLSQAIRGKRSSFLLMDAVSFLPEASFGYARFGGLGNLGLGGLYGIGSSGLNGVYLPNQSILTGTSSRVSNTAVGQYDYRLSPRSSLTFTGSYALLRFPDSGFIDTNAGIFGMGYNHSFTPRDTVAITYMGSVFRYDQPSNDFNNHIVALMYRHQISHLLLLRLGGGPQFNTFNNSAAPGTKASWYANALLSYRLPRTALGLSFRHYTTGGSGIFPGAESDQVAVSVGRELTRMWSLDLNMGFSHNQSLLATSNSQTFNTWYGTANLQRPLGRYMSLFLSYNLQQQSSNNSFCAGSSCGTFYTRNFFSIGFSWHPNAVELGGTD
jgi:hypothetical protein